MKIKSDPLRAEHVVEMGEILSEVTRQKPAAVWMQKMSTAGIPCGPVNTVDKVVKDPQVLAREMLVDVQVPKAGPVTVAGCPIKLSATPGKAQGPAPGLGEHTEAVLADWLHISADAVARLREEGVV